MKKKMFVLLLLSLLILIGLFLRLKYWPDFLTFGYEQARDAQLSTIIYSQKKLTLLGPTTEIEGVFHGPIYYYLIGLIYFLFGKNPSWVALWHILMNLACIPIVFWVGKKMFSQRVGLIAAAVFTISYEVISYSLWLSNPSPGLPFIILTYFFFYRAFKENLKFLPLASFLLAISISFDLIIVVNLFGAIALGLIYNKKRINLKTGVASFLAFVIPLINYPLFEIRHSFLMTKKLLSVLGSQDNEFKNVFQYLFNFSEGLAKEFANVFFPIHGFFAGLLMITLFIFLWKNLRQKKLFSNPYGLVLVWLLVNFTTFLISAAVTNSEFSYFGVNAASSLLLAAFLDNLIVKKRFFWVILISSLVVLGSLRAWQKFLPNPQRRLFDSQRGVILKDTLATIDYTYSQSNKKSFFVDTVTVPLYISPLWDYLYSWYGQKKYGYLPTKETKVSDQFLIIEPGWGDTYKIFRQRAIDNLNKTTTIDEEQKFGMITVEKRSASSEKK